MRLAGPEVISWILSILQVADIEKDLSRPIMALATDLEFMKSAFSNADCMGMCGVLANEEVTWNEKKKKFVRR